MRCLFAMIFMLLSTTCTGSEPATSRGPTAPIVQVKREIYHKCPRPKTAPLVSVRYVGPGLLREEIHTTIAKSDTPKKPMRRWSKDNGRTWSDFEPMPEFITYPQGVRVVWAPGTYFYDAQRDAILSIWIRQTLLKKKYYNQSFSRFSKDLVRTWSEPRQLMYEPGASFDSKKPFDPEYLNNNKVYYGNNIIRHSNGTLLHVVASVNIPKDAPDPNPEKISTWGAPADARCIGSLCFIGRWDDQLGDYRWTAGKPVWVSRSVSSRGLAEPEVAELKDGRVLAVWRISNASLDPKKSPGHKYFSVSTDGGLTLSEPKPWTYDDGTPFYSASAIHRLIRHSVTGKLYWIGNISPGPTRGNYPRYPLIIAEVDETIPAIKRNTVTVIDTRRKGEGPKVQMSNFSLFENREDHTLEIYLTRLGEDPKNTWTANAYKYTLRFE